MKTIGLRDLSVDAEISKKYLDPIDKMPGIKYFQTKTDAYLLAAVIGFKKKTRIPSTSKQSVRRANELSDEQDLIIQTIGFCEMNNVDLLVPEEEPRKQLFRLIEEYANGGAKTLFELLIMPRDDTKPLDQQVFSLLKKFKVSE